VAAVMRKTPGKRASRSEGVIRLRPKKAWWAGFVLLLAPQDMGIADAVLITLQTVINEVCFCSDSNELKTYQEALL
jgi:hypothetical protein